jgi:hypothetical protein
LTEEGYIGSPCHIATLQQHNSIISWRGMRM